MSTPPITTPSDINSPVAPPRASGFLGGVYNVVGPQLAAAEEDARRTRLAQMDYHFKAMNDPALAWDPNDSPEVAAHKKALHDYAVGEFTKLAPKSAKPMVQQLGQLISHVRGHGEQGPQANGAPGSKTPLIPPPPQASAQTAPAYGAPGEHALSVAPSSAPAIPPPPTGADLASASRAGAAQFGLQTAKQHEADAAAVALASKQAGELAEPGISGKMLDVINQLPEEQRTPAMIRSGMIPLKYMARLTGSGGGFAEDLREQGYKVPDSIPDKQWVNVKQSPIGQEFTPGAPPSGQYAVTPAGVETKYQAGIEKEKREFGRRLTLQQNQLQDAVQRGDHSQAVKIRNEAIVNSATAQRRAQIMDQSYADAMKAQAGGTTNQQAELNLLAQHVLMTTGAGEKGATRATKALFDEARQSAPWLESVEARFDKNGYLSGVTLTPGQMDNMRELAHERVGVMNENVDNMNTTFQRELQFRQGRGMPKPSGAGAAGAAGAVTLTGPPKKWNAKTGRYE